MNVVVNMVCLSRRMMLIGLGLLLVDEGGGGRGRLKMVLLVH